MPISRFDQVLRRDDFPSRWHAGDPGGSPTVDQSLSEQDGRTYPSTTSEYVSGSFRIASTTIFLNPFAPSIPPSKTTPTAENKQALSSGTFLSSSVPASPGKRTAILPPSPPDFAFLEGPLPVVAYGEPAAEPIWDAGVNRFGAERLSFRCLTDGAGVFPPPKADGVDAAGDGLTAVTMSCSPFVIGIEERCWLAEDAGRGFGG